MAETEAQMMVELSKHLEEFRVNSARRLEEQKLHRQNLEKQMMEMKELLLNMAKGQQEEASAPRSPTSPLNEQSQSVDDYLGRFECAHHVLDEMPEPKEVSDSTAHQVLDKMPSDLNHDLAAHHVLDETPKSVNTIEIDDTESMEQEESIRDEPIVVDELLHQVALQVLDEMPEFTDEIDLEIARVSSTEERYDLEVLGSTFVQIDESSEDGGEALFEVVNRIERDEDPSQILVPNDPKSAKESSVLIAHQLLDKMPQPTKTLKVDLIAILTKNDDDDDLFEMASWIEEDFEPPTYTKGYMRLMCFDPGGLLVINAFSCLIANEKSHFGHAVGKLIFYPGNYVDEVLVVLQAFDYELRDVAAEVEVLILEVLIGSLFEVLIFDPGGQLDLTRCWHLQSTFASVALPLCIHCSVYDPWGQGSSQGGSIVTGKWVRCGILMTFAIKPGLPFNFVH